MHVLGRIALAWWYFLTNRNNKIARQRLKICADCPNNKWGVCKICGCPLQTKSRLYDEHCPIEKW